MNAVMTRSGPPIRAAYSCLCGAPLVLSTALARNFLSGCRGSNSGCMTPSHAYYHYTTARPFEVLFRAAGNRTRSTRTRIVRTTGILRPERRLHSRMYNTCSFAPPCAERENMPRGIFSRARWSRIFPRRRSEISRPRLAVAQACATSLRPAQREQMCRRAYLLVSVHSTYKTLNRLKTYLSRFWEYYQSTPSLQKALASTG